MLKLIFIFLTLTPGYPTLGVYYDVLKELESQLNFTTALFRRKDGAWGYVYPQNDGSYEATGMIGDIFFKRADIALASLTINLKRGIYIDYAIPFTKEPVGLFIKSKSLQGDFDFHLLLSPLRYVMTHSSYWYKSTGTNTMAVLIKTAQWPNSNTQAPKLLILKNTMVSS